MQAPSSAHRVVLLAILAGLPAAAVGSSNAAHAASANDDGILCQLATAQAEVQSGIPDQLLNAISRVESGRYDSGTGRVRGWPWTINAQGRGHYYDTKEEAVAAARQFQAQGIQSIDVGCMQINLMFHPEGFTSLEQAFDPGANAAFAGRFLINLFHQTGSWPHAAAAYHSQTPNLGIDYQHHVLDAWAEPIDRPAHGKAAKRHDADTDRDTGGTPTLAATPHHAPTTAATPESATTMADTGGSAGVTPFGARPLGGFGRVLRTESRAPARTVLAGATGRDLAAYRALPVAFAGLPSRLMRPAAMRWPR